ncbi:MAG: calcium-binding EGF-like domain-containing protein [Flavobacteriales bacterium]
MSSLYNKLLLFLLLAVSSLFFSCNKCKEVECKNDGVCVDGICDCPDAFTGDQCSLQKEPRSLVIQKVRISNVKDYLNYEWDEEEGEELPDVFLGIQKGIETKFWFTSREIYRNSNANTFEFSEEMGLTLDDIDLTLRFSLLDDDVTFSQELYWCTARLYWAKNQLPEVYTYVYNTGVKLEVWLDYRY